MSTSDARDGQANSLIYLSLILGGVVALTFLKEIFGGDPLDSMVIQSFEHVFALDAAADSWAPMYLAALEKINNPDVGIYQTIFFENHVKFQYPPISLLPFMVFVWLDITYESIVYYLNLVSLVSIVGIAVCLYVLAIKVAEQYNGRVAHSTGVKIVFFLLMLIGTFSFYPLLRGYELGQIQTLLDFLISLAFVAWLINGKLFAGVLIALATLVKPHFGLLIIWAMIRKEGRFCVGMLLVLIPAGIVSLLVFGFREHLDYLSVLSYIGKHGEVYWPNQSINGLLNRLFSDINPLVWMAESYAPYNSYVRFGTLISTIGFLLFGLLYRQRNAANNPVLSALDLSTMIILLTIASPIAWEHHYGAIWPVIILVLSAAINLAKTAPNWTVKLCLALAVLGYYLDANLFQFVTQENFITAPVNLIQSYFFYGALLLLASVIILRKQLKSLYDPVRMGENDNKSVHKPA